MYIFVHVNIHMYLHTYIPPAGRHSTPQVGHTLH
jgi:hypothetical protein